MAATLTSMRGIIKRFPGNLANDGVDLDIAPGTIHALLGENGAGKTTLMNILSGRYRPDAGEIFVGDACVRFHAPRDALQAGIGMVHQHFMLVANQTVAENIALGHERPRAFLRWSRIEEEVRRLSETYGLPLDPRSRIDELSLGQQQRTEILKLLYRRTDLLILDEPTAVLSPGEIDALFATLRRIVLEGRSVVFITHKLEEVMEIADRITILRRGRRVADLTPSEVRSRRELARLMVGREVVLKVDRPPVPLGETVLELRDCSGLGPQGHPVFQRVSFAVRRGEIFSIVGVAGNGQRELVASIVGARPLAAGQILLFGKPRTPGGVPPMDRLAYIPEDRTGTGSLPGLDLADNLLLTTYPGFCRRGIFQREAALQWAGAQLDRFRVVAESLQTPARQLSGGNLQKLILARELSKKPSFVIAEQPTHGLDIGATEEVWNELLRQREEAGVLLISGDLREALSLSDRIAVMFRGRLMGVLSADDEDAIAEIGPMMAGVRREI